MSPAAGPGDVATVLPSASPASSPGKGGINGAEPAKKRRNRRGKKRGSSSTGTQQANENSAAAAGGRTPSASLSPPPPPPPHVPSKPSPSPGSSASSRGNPVEENSAAGQRPDPAAAAAGSSAASSAATIGDPSAARSPKKKTGEKGGVTSAASSPVRAIKDPSVVLQARSPNKKPVGGGSGTVQLTSTTSRSRIEVVVSNFSYSYIHSHASSTLAQHASVRQLKAADAAGSASSGTLPDHAVSEIGGTEDMVRNELLKYVPLWVIDFEPQLQFLKFLYEYTIPGEQYPFYKAQVLSLSKRKCYILEVNFDHLKSSFFKNTTQYCDLVFKIVNNPDRTQSWLRKVVFVFLKSESFNADEKTIDSNAKVDFTNKPQSIIMLSDALKDKTAVVRKLCVVNNEVTMNASTAYGTSTFLAVLAELLNRHRKDKSYNGKFEIGNIVIVNSKLCWILMEPSPVKSTCEMKSDLGQLWTIMEQYYSNDEGHLPLYFAELKDDLVNGKLSNVTMEWFRLHLEYHPAFMPSMVRRNMIYGLKSVIQDNKSLMDKDFTSFLEKEPFESKDWRDKIKKGHSNIMLRVYMHRTISLKQDPVAKKGSSDDYFANTWEGLLWYIRNFLMHANKTAKVVDTDEIELFAASKFPTLLPRLLKVVSSNCKIQPYFTGVFSSYRTSRSNPKDLPS